MKKVYIVCEPKQKIASQPVKAVDLTPAAEWGEPVILLNYNQIQLDPTSTVQTLHERLVDFNDSDYLVPIGDPVLMCAAATIAACRNKGRIKLLKWDRIVRRYIPIQLDYNA